MTPQAARKPLLNGPRARVIVSPARRAAFDILKRVEEDGAFAATLLATLDDEMRTDDRALCNELVLGVLRRQLWLDSALKHFAKRSLESMDIAVRLALRLGLYQLRYLSRVPASAAVNESVNLVHAARVRSAAGLVNAVLRRVTREADYDPAANIADPIQRMAIETSHPAWLIERWVHAFGVAETEAFAGANNNPAPVAFRFTSRVPEKRGLLDELRAAGASLEPSRLVPDAWRIRGAGDMLQRLARKGLVYVQDEASQLVAHVVGAKPGDRVLDVCAAPGSKTTHIAARAPQALIIAGDMHQHRLHTLRQLAATQGANTIGIVAYDGVKSLPFANGSFDRVLVDAPCSGTGTLRHNPEIRWRITVADIIELAARQKLILSHAAKLVRRDGQLIYSTCSVEPEENESVVQAFLKDSHDFEPVEPDWPRPASRGWVRSDLVTASGAVRTWPQRNDVDGFFIAAFTRV